MAKTSAVRKTADPALVEELVDAWSSLGRNHRRPERIDVLKTHHRQPKVCRLVGGAPAGGDIIAKRSKSSAVEPILYEYVLAGVPGTPRCHGIVPSRDDGRWTFLEHVDGERCTAHIAEHRALTARWLGTLSSVTSNMPSGHLLPLHDSAYYRNQLRTARHRMSAALGSPMIDGPGRPQLATAVNRCDLLDSQWDTLDALTEDIPPSLVHGDLQAKNVKIRQRAGKVELVAFDWEFSGYGVPIADLAEFAVEQRWLELSGILDQMGSTNGSVPDRLRRLTTAGRIFRLITWFEWESRSLAQAWPESTISRIALYDLRLDESLRSLAMDA